MNKPKEVVMAKLIGRVSYVLKKSGWKPCFDSEGKLDDSFRQRFHREYMVGKTIVLLRVGIDDIDRWDYALSISKISSFFFNEEEIFLDKQLEGSFNPEVAMINEVSYTITTDGDISTHARHHAHDPDDSETKWILVAHERLSGLTSQIHDGSSLCSRHPRKTMRI